MKSRPGRRTAVTVLVIYYVKRSGAVLHKGFRPERKKDLKDGGVIRLKPNLEFTTLESFEALMNKIGRAHV